MDSGVRIAAALAAVLLFLGTARAQIPDPGSQGKTPLSWASDLPAALLQAQAAKKPVVLDIGPDWNIDAKRMDNETFADARVQELLKNCVLVKVNPEASPDARAVADRYDARVYPNIVIVNYQGEALAQKSGFQEAEKFRDFLSKNLADFKDNPLGYVAAALPSDDPLFAAIAKMPAPATLPPHTPAYFLLDHAEVTVRKDGSAHMVLRKAYYMVDGDLITDNSYAGMSTTYTSSREKVKFTAGRILDLQGKGRNLDLAQIEDKPSYSDQNIYWDVRRVGVTFPRLKTGQILDFVEERDLLPTVPGHFEFLWDTGGERSTIVSGDLTIHFPAELGLIKTPVRCDTAIEETKAADGTVTWHLHTASLAKTREALFVPATYESWSGYVFNTPWSWEAMAKWYQDLCAGRDVLSPEAVAKVAELRGQHSDPTELAFAIYQWVAREIRYVSVDFGRSSYEPHRVADTFRLKYGDCKDKALLLKAMLNEAGLPASLVLLGTGDGRKVEGTEARLNAFNHCIVSTEISGPPIYLDATVNAPTLGWLPSPDCNVEALKVANPGEKGGMVTLPPYQALEGRNSQLSRIELHPDGSALISEEYSVEGVTAEILKKRMGTVPQDRLRKSLDQTYEKEGRKLIDFSMTDPSDTSGKFALKMTFTEPRFASLSADGLILKLGGSGLTPGQDWTERLSDPRVEPFRFYPLDPMVKRYEVTLPPGMKLTSKPADLRIDLPFLNTSRIVTVDGSNLTLVESYTVKDATVPAENADQVAKAFRQLQNHRDTVYILTQDTTAAAAPTATTASPAVTAQ